MEENQSSSESRKRDFLLPASIIVAALLVSGALVYNTGSKNLAAQAQPSAPSKDVPTDLVDDDVILGDPKAPVTIVEFGDYQCPFCRKLFVESENKIRNEYIKTGKARMVYRDFPLDAIHPEARPAAEASQCAAEQGKFWAYHDLLFARQKELSGANYVKWAGELGLDVKKFEECYTFGKYAAEVAKDYENGLLLGVQGTPATFINGQFIPGAQPYSVFKAAIDAKLSLVDKN